MKLSLGDGKSYKPSMKNCDRCGKLLRENELKSFHWETSKEALGGSFCLDCWFACAWRLHCKIDNTISDFFFPLSKWDNYKKFKAAKFLEHKDNEPTNLA